MRVPRVRDLNLAFSPNTFIVLISIYVNNVCFKFHWLSLKCVRELHDNRFTNNTYSCRIIYRKLMN